MKIFPKLSLTGQILLALVLACVAGFFLQENVQFADEYIKPFGVIFLNLLKFIVVPLVMFSIVSGIVTMQDVSKVGRLGIQAMTYFMLTTLFAATLGLLVPTLMLDWLPVFDLNVGSLTTEVPNLSLMDQVVIFFPSNAIEPILSNSMMQVIVIALLLGIAIVHVGSKAEPVKQLVLSFNEVVTKILSYIMAVSPIGVFCMLTPVVATNGPQVLGSYAALIGVDYFCFFLHALLVYATTVYLLARMSPLRFFKGMTPAMLFAYSSGSSVATLPYTMACTQRLGVRKELGNFVLSLGATVNMDGVAIYLGVTSVFMAHSCGMDLSMSQYIAIAISATIVSIGTPAIPGGSLALMAMVFASAGIPVEGVAIAAGIDRLVDMARTTMSITGDAACAVILQRYSKDKSMKEE